MGGMSGGGGLGGDVQQYASGLGQMLTAKKAAQASKAGSQAMQAAARSAQRIQQQSTDQAVARLEEERAAAQTRLNPYVQMGAGAVSRLTGQPTPGAQTPAAVWSANAWRAPVVDTSSRKLFDTTGAPRQTAPTYPPPGAPYQPTSAQTGGLVTVQAPTGETRQMSVAQAQQAVARGARVIS